LFAKPWTIPLLTTALVVGHFAGMYDANQSLVTDTRYYTHFAFEIADGAVPHRDFFGNKTQFMAMFAGMQVAVANLLGLDALAVLRLVSLGLAALGAILLFALQRELQGGDAVAAWLGFLPYLGFAYIGTLAATGPVPKLLMALAATAAALLVARGHWFAAGLASAIAPIDWQIGLFACFGVFAAAALDERPRRAFARSALAVLLVAGAFVLYFALSGALEMMLAQAVGASFARGAEAGGPLFKFAGIATRLSMNASGEFVLIAVGLIGLVVFPFWLRSPRYATQRKPIVVLVIYHYGVLAFSSIDFQGSGDTMLLLHSFAFFAGVSLVSLWFALLPRIPEVRLGHATVAVVILSLLLVRPVVRDLPRVEAPDAPLGVTLEDQRTLARRLHARAGDRPMLVLGPTELLVLEDFDHETIFHFWNDATRFEYARTRGLEDEDLLAALVDEVRPDFIVASRYLSFPPDIPYRGVDLGSPGGYAVRVFERDEAKASRLKAGPRSVLPGRHPERDDDA
jgi:hypothetical protein